MIRFENTEVLGWGAAIRGMRNPMNSWNRSDSGSCKDMDCDVCPFGTDNETGLCRVGSDFIIGLNDLKLMKQLANAGPVHAKYRRMIQVYVDITAPFYWWKEFDTYKVGTVTNSCSTMHKIHERDLTPNDFSREHLDAEDYAALVYIIDRINACRKVFLATDDKQAWYGMIQLLPTSYNQKRTIMMSYEVLANIYISRKNHKLDEWRAMCKWIEELPYSELITGLKGE